MVVRGNLFEEPGIIDSNVHNGRVIEVLESDKERVSFIVGWQGEGCFSGLEKEEVTKSWTDIEIALLQGTLDVALKVGMKQKRVTIKIDRTELPALLRYREQHLENKGARRPS